MNEFNNFGYKTFSRKIMKEKLPYPIYTKWKLATRKTDVLDRATADMIAHAMKEWALSLGVTHYCHWFQPLSGKTAEKHDSFIDIGSHGEPILRFSGKALIKGEPDASSFPSGGLRATFEARGYTYWDCTSPAFIRDNVLCIPSVFISFNGEPLDCKTPLLRSIDVISNEAKRIVHAFGDKDVLSITPTIGLEQEYFLIDKTLFEKRRDLYLTGRTLVGKIPPKGQELEDHYFGVIPPRVTAFMKDVNQELWNLGIYAKTEHNEVAPCQFELASIFADVNVAIDQNLIIMDVLKRTAIKHNLVCLLHEKPFNGVNGSGKHNNWSLMTNDNQNLLDPGDKPHENVRFLLFVCAILKAVDKYPELIRLTCSGPGNDFRLGANEAPPAVVSMYLGQQVEFILENLEKGKPVKFEQSSLSSFGLSTLSYLPKDISDRNRTSPVAFTGNKFEFRMLGSSLNAASLNTVLNLTIGDTLSEIADQLEKCKYRQDLREKALDICRDIIKNHKRILFDGNGYGADWINEAKKRNLSNIKTFVEAIKYYNSKETVKLFSKYNILSEIELDARSIVLYENYINTIAIEAKTISSMVYNDIIPALIKNIKEFENVDINYTNNKVELFKKAIYNLDVTISKLNEELDNIPKDSEEKAGIYILNNLVPLIKNAREIIDNVETFMDRDLYPYPNYESIFNSLE